MDFQHFVTHATTDDLSDAAVMVRPTYEELKAYGHQFPDFILSCQFDGRPCSMDDFYEFPNKKYGW